MTPQPDPIEWDDEMYDLFANSFDDTPLECGVENPEQCESCT